MSEQCVPIEKVRGIPIRVDKLVFSTGFAVSRSESRRLVEAGAVDIDGDRAGLEEVIVESQYSGFVLRVGRKQVRVVIPELSDRISV